MLTGGSGLFYILAALLALFGFSIATYIRHKKASFQPLVCPIGHSCDTVIHSDYSRFLGIPLEYMGMLYYALVAFSYITLVLRPELALPIVFLGLLIVSLIAFLFSIYLTFIQAFALKQWCTWCLISAGLCTLIFSATLLGSEYGFIALLAEHKMLFLGLHLLGFAFGLGGATISDIMFFKFLKDFRISQTEASVLRTLSQVIWFGLALAILSGLGMYLPATSYLNESAKFLVKMIVVGVILVNGAFLNLYVAPKLVTMTFGKWEESVAGSMRRARKAAFAMGAISMVSWYSAAILGFLNASPASFSVILGIYVGLLAIAIVTSQVMERIMGRLPMPSPPAGGPENEEA